MFAKHFKDVDEFDVNVFKLIRSLRRNGVWFSHPHAERVVADAASRDAFSGCRHPRPVANPVRHTLCTRVHPWKMTCRKPSRWKKNKKKRRTSQWTLTMQDLSRLYRHLLQEVLFGICNEKEMRGGGQWLMWENQESFRSVLFNEHIWAPLIEEVFHDIPKI